MTRRNVEELIWYMPTVAEHATNTWAAGFARSIQRQSRRKGWQPSPKQLACMERLVAELFMHSLADEVELIEGDAA